MDALDVQKVAARAFVSLMGGDLDKIADFIANQQMAINGLTQNNQQFAESFRAQNAAELAATDSQHMQHAIALVRSEFAKEPHGVTMFKVFNAQLDYIEQRAAV